MAATSWYGRPSSSAGYWRGGMSDGPLWQGQGSGYGPAVQGAGVMPPGNAAQSSGGWHPTVVYLLLFVAAELVAVHVLTRVLK